MGIAVVSIVWVISAYFAIRKPPYFAIIYGLIGNEYDSLGIGGYLLTYNSYYFYGMHILLLLTVIISLVHYFKENVTNYKGIIFFSIIFLLLIFISTLYNFFTVSSRQILEQALNNIASYSPAILIIWISYYQEKKMKTLFKSFIIFQIAISILVLYLPLVNIHFLDVIKGANYSSDLFVENNIVAGFNNFYEVFINKYYFNHFAQYHNSNDLGLYAGTCLFICISYLFFEDKKIQTLELAFERRKIKILPIYFLIIIMSLFAWFNSGNRGVVIGIACAYAIYLLSNREFLMKVRNIVFLLFITSIFLISFSSLQNVMSYFFVSADNVSVTARVTLFQNGIDYLKSNWGIGNGGNLSDLIAVNIDPHQLPLRISVLFGVMTGIVSIIVIYVIPISYLLIYKKFSFYSIGLLCIVWFTSLTNNYNDIVLFWLAFAEAIIDLLRLKAYDKENPVQ